MEETISLKELMQTLKKRLSLIILITVAAVTISGAVSFFVLTPIYQSTAQLLVNQAKSDQPIYNPSEIQTNLQLINTYNVIIKSPFILDKVIDEMNLDATAKGLSENITVQSAKDSQVVNLTVQDPNPRKAAELANKIAEVFEKEIVPLMKVDNVNIISKAEINPSPVKPQPMLNIAIAFVVGLMAGVGLAFLLEYLDNTVKTAEDVERLLELPVLGSIATFEDQKVERPERAARKTRVRSETIG
ncbi:capsular biosynthesis protein [Bacillus sp. FJAT-49732]|uniref:Capsular biosynthesis protein n=1 Tax=Lederbergia citrisecunda TaxID=2833583 RepID=A0A942TNJ2_9BACI|nr:Wzz/FepE/Etk N-terminal domain-containing protein [Lederbergia citrisecunda]MBS4200608.1 capsular biosynthesis protein [Lederbergia citrisecunda]